MIEGTVGPIMHEMSIAASMLEAVQAESAKHNAHVRAVGLKIGQLSGVDTESLRFCFETLVQDTDLAPLALEIEALPWRNRCRQCARDFAVEEYRTECPQCGSAETELASGKELEFAYMEIDE
jgi:hydrogenase nickel incorporation protein HypA/HybF